MVSRNVAILCKHARNASRPFVIPPRQIGRPLYAENPDVRYGVSAIRVEPLWITRATSINIVDNSLSDLSTAIRKPRHSEDRQKNKS